MASTLQKLTSVVHQATAKHSATVIFIHGLGDSGHGWAPVGEELGRHLPHVKFIFPNAPDMPVTLNYGMAMPSWYDIKALSTIDTDQDEAGMLKSRQQVMQIIREEVEQNNIPANRIVIGGFSQGCVMGLLTGLTAEYKFAGIVSLSGYMPLHKKIMNMASDANRKTPIFWGHGDADQVVRYDYGVHSVELLKKNKFDVRFTTYRNLGHGSSPQEIRDLLNFLKEVIPAEPKA
ncbi:Phospholipase/carboxylesterase [Linnemannia elongata AG-77]|uniref:Acyl-protein thioesterase 1 n=1 Tax=Linnemannia elongata AG-77 TaxID=1314771 RepID=A0A197KBV5_9FUNG|nr:Phospholipase/carboxylesterase [Linnemannia elongata AG-77]